MIENQILNIFAKHGLEVMPDSIVFNEERRLPVDEEDKKVSFVYEIEQDPEEKHLYFLRIHNWKKDLHTNVGIDDRQVDATPEELQEIQKKFEQKVKERKRITTLRQETAAIEAERELESCDAVAGFPPYAKDKALKSIHGAKTKGHLLIVPMRDMEGKLWSYQTISEDRKNFKKYAKTSGCFFTIGEIKDTAYFAEGFATAATIFEATGIATIVCFSAHNIIEVARQFRKTYPTLKMIIASDFDEVGQKVGIKAAKMVQGIFKPPPFEFIHPDYTDWNDFRKLYGEELTKMKLVELKEASKPFISKQNWIENWMKENKCEIDYRGLVKVNGDFKSLPILQRDIFLAQETEKLSIRQELISAYTQAWADRIRDGIFKRITDNLFLPPKKPIDAMGSIAYFIIALTGKTDDLNMLALTHFIWQVKRKALRLPVEHHMMLLITGKSGAGKSVAIDKHLLTPLEDLWINASMDACSDEKKGNLFTDYLVVSMDETAGMHKTDSNALKNLITSDNLTYRMAYDRNSTIAYNRSTLIGTSNHSWDEIVRDPTSNRRFWAIESRDLCDWETINSLDYVDLWRSVDAHQPCPILPVLDRIREVQERYRPRTAAEDFFQEYTIEKSETRFTKNEDILEAFHKFGLRSGHPAYSVTQRSLSNLLKSKGFEQVRNRDYRGWKCIITGINNSE